MSTHETVGEKLARLSAAVRERGLNAGALGVAVALWSFADSRIGEAFPSLSDLCGRALVSERCAQTHLRDLESNGLVWVIRRDMTPVNGGVADPPLAALVQRDREGSPCAVPHGRNLYLVRPLASQAAVDAWTADGRALGRKRTVAPASTVKAPHTAPPRIVAPEKLALTPETRERGHSLFARLCEAAGRAATLAASPSLEAECAAMLVRLDANEREVRYMGALIARDDQRAKWMKKPGPVTLASLATFRGKEDASHNWRSLCALLSTARHEIFQADRRREAEERLARERAQKEEAARREDERLRNTYPNLPWDTQPKLAKSKALSSERAIAEKRAPETRAPRAETWRDVSERNRRDIARLRPKYPHLGWRDDESASGLDLVALTEARALEAEEIEASAVVRADTIASASDVQHRASQPKAVPIESSGDPWVSAAARAGVKL